MIHRRHFAALAGFAFLSTAATAQTANFSKHQFATGNTFTDTHSPLYLTDGKVGPRNRWATGGGGRHRCNIFLGEAVEIGSIHVYSVGYDGQPIGAFSVNYKNAMGQIVPVPGASVAGNTDTAINVVFAAPVVTDQIQITVVDPFARIDEVAAFPPNGGAGYPLGTDVNLHLARQHRVATTTASSTAPGTTRRAAVDGYVNDTSYWQSNAAGPHTLEFDITDPPETSNPVSIRTETTPVVIGGVHLYTGLTNGTGIISRARVQTFDEGSGLWTDVPGSEFTNNTQGFVAINFNSPVETARFRLVVTDTGSVIVREFVPLPPEPATPWPEGTSVTFSDVLDYTELSDDFFSLEPDANGFSLTSNDSGDVFTAEPQQMLSRQHLQQYQILLDVGTDTYRIRNRVSGKCLAIENASLLTGAAVIESDYHGMPHQRWHREVDGSGLTRFVNAYSGLAIEAEFDGAGSTLVQMPLGASTMQWWQVTQADYFPKKGVGGFPLRADEFGISWAYNWGKLGTDYPTNVDYWPMQWGSFFWDSWPELVPSWKRDADPYMLMGYNEPDASSQSNVPVASAIAMWPRNEATDTPLLGPAPVNPTNQWIVDFMQGVADHEMRVDYAAVHRYPGPDPDNFINSLQNTYNAFGRELIVSEFSVVDWNNTNSWNDDQVYNFFVEVFWRMEKLDFVRRWAMFVFTDDPANAISDNRGEMLFADGSLTPEGKLFSAWDGDTIIRTDTPYYLHNEGQFKRPGAVEAGSGSASITLGNRTNDDEAYQWSLEPVATTGRVRIRSVLDGRLLAANGAALELVPAGTTGSAVEFQYNEAQHGWFHIDHPGTNQRLRINTSFELTSQNNTGDWTRWSFVRVHEAPPSAPRGVTAVPLTQGDVFVSWLPHGFRDLQAFAVYRTDPGGGTQLIDSNVFQESFLDIVPAPGTYIYEITAIGDTGESLPTISMPVSVETCAADFNGDFIVSPQDAADLLTAVQAGLDYNADGASNFFDVLSFLEIYDAGCSP